MGLSNKEQLHYEIGVLLFNLVSETEYAVQPAERYDAVGNLHSLLDALHIEDTTPLMPGFLAECENYGIKKHRAKNLFKKSCEVLQNY